jgi:glucose-6-phosphate 1-dehydrogenase
VLYVIFGATGDLSRRKLLPALYELCVEGLLPDGFSLIGAAREPLRSDEFRTMAERAIRERARRRPVDDRALARLLGRAHYEPLEFADDAGFRGLAARLESLEPAGARPCRLFHCATPPAAYAAIVRQMEAAGLAGHGEPGRSRMLIEKPFGSSLASARELNALVARAFGEECVYRIDHYLGKETVQNIVAFRFANSIFEPLWCGQYVDNVQVTVAEDIGLEGRANYYERTGALRDMVQNHLMQLLALTAMEPPVPFDHFALRDEKLKVLKAVAPLTGASVDRWSVRAQYDGYRQEPGVAPDSTTETFVALRLSVDNWRWAGVPFYLRTGKRLARQLSEVRVEFKVPPYITFGRKATRELEPNAIVLRIQPDEGISLRFGAKTPDHGMRIRTVDMDFAYRRSFERSGADPYERLLVDAMAGDPTYFVGAAEVEASWVVVDPIEERWAYGCPPLATYPAGSRGPVEADRMLAREGRRWRDL